MFLMNLAPTGKLKRYVLKHFALDIVSQRAFWSYIGPYRPGRQRERQFLIFEPWKASRILHPLHPSPWNAAQLKSNHGASAPVWSVFRRDCGVVVWGSSQNHCKDDEEKYRRCSNAPRPSRTRQQSSWPRRWCGIRRWVAVVRPGLGGGWRGEQRWWRSSGCWDRAWEGGPSTVQPESAARSGCPTEKVEAGAGESRVLPLRVVWRRTTKPREDTPRSCWTSAASFWRSIFLASRGPKL